MPTKYYSIMLEGCDATTTLILPLSQSAVTLLTNIEKLSDHKAAGNGCMPILILTCMDECCKHGTPNDYSWCSDCCEEE